MIASILKLISDWLPYVAFFGGIILLLFVIVVTVIDVFFMRHKKPTESKSAELVAIEGLTEQIKQLLENKKNQDKNVNDEPTKSK